MTLDNNWGDESPTLTKRAVVWFGGRHKVALASDTFPQFAGRVGVTIAPVIGVPAAAIAGSVAATHLAYGLSSALGAQVSDVGGSVLLTSLLAPYPVAAAAAAIFLVGNPTREQERARIAAMLRTSRVGGIAITTAALVAAATIDTGDAVGVLHSQAAMTGADSVAAAAATLTGVSILGGKVFTALVGRSTARQGLGE